MTETGLKSGIIEILFFLCFCFNQMIKIIV